MAHPMPRTNETDSCRSDAPEADEWRTRSHLTLFVDNIPCDWMAAELKSFLDGFGRTVKIEIFENREVLLLSIPI